jgi:hypothetical protein
MSRFWSTLAWLRTRFDASAGAASATVALLLAIALAAGFFVGVRAQTVTTVDFPAANLQGTIGYFRAQPGRTPRELADAFHRIQSATDGIRADLLELAAATADVIDIDDPIGNVAITTIIPTYERRDDNNDIMVRLAITFNPPSPALTFDRVQVTVEVPADDDPTPLDPTGGPLRYGGEFADLIGSSSYTVNVYLPPPIQQEGWRVYVVSGGSAPTPIPARTRWLRSIRCRAAAAGRSG